MEEVFAMMAFVYVIGMMAAFGITLAARTKDVPITVWHTISAVLLWPVFIAAMITIITWEE